MWHYIFLLLRRQPDKNALVGGGFLVAACALILLSATTQTTVVQADQIIGQSWRPAYDLVVLPPGTQTQTGSVVPPDVFEQYASRITLQQYNQISQIPDVALAAPLAYVGYVQLPLPMLQFSDKPFPPGFYRVDTTLSSFNGLRQLNQRHESTLYYQAPTCFEDRAMAALELQGVHISLLDCTGSTFHVPVQHFLAYDQGTYMLAAIDPPSENLLTHVDQSVIIGRTLNSLDTLGANNDNPHLTISYKIAEQTKEGPGYRYVDADVENDNIPLLVNSWSQEQANLNVTLTRLTSNDPDAQTMLALGGASYLYHLATGQVLYQGPVPLPDDNLQRMAHDLLIWDGYTWHPGNSTDSNLAAYTHLMNFLYAPSPLTYVPTDPPPSQGGTAYTLVPSAQQDPVELVPAPVNSYFPADQHQGPEVLFRSLVPLHIGTTSTIPYYSTVYTPSLLGQFSSDSLPADMSNVLNWLPEATFMPPPVVMRYDAQGKPVTPTELLPTGNATTSVVQSPLAFTTLQVACQLIGDACISAIRVRITGAVTTEQSSLEHVQQVAQKIEDKTGLHVQVMMGSSPQPTLVNIPGVKQGENGASHTIEPVGWAEERWIRLGAGVIYLGQLGMTRQVLLGMILAACLGYLIVAFSSLMSGQRREYAILHALGWPPWQMMRLFLGQALTLAGAGSLLGIGLALLIIWLIGAAAIWPIVLSALPLILGLTLLSMLYPVWQLWHIQPMTLLRGNAPIIAMGMVSLRRIAWFIPIGALVLRNITRSRIRSLLTVSSVFFASALLTVMCSSILELRQTLIGTLLGDYILLQTSVLQITDGVFAVLLAFLSITTLLLLQVRERRQEIGVLQALGWRTSMVQRLFLKEGILLALAGALPGVVLALWFLMGQHTDVSLLPSLLIGCGVAAIMLMIALAAFIPAMYTIKGMRVMDIVHAE